jgi:hypothetical protein
MNFLKPITLSVMTLLSLGAYAGDAENVALIMKTSQVATDFKSLTLLSKESVQKNQSTLQVMSKFSLLSGDCNTIYEIQETILSGKPASNSVAKKTQTCLKKELGLYRGYMGTQNFITTKNISKDDALANCQLNAKKNPGQDISCTWNGALIFAKKGVPVGLYKGYMGIQNFITTKNISKDDALANCQLNAKNNPEKDVNCTWNGFKIFGK